jgi:hypothetical protein
MPVRISISRKGNVEFATVSVASSDTVFWMNEDKDAAHWPVLNGVNLTLTQVAPAPSDNSVSWSVANAGGTPPFQITYGCSIDKHGAEKGIINVYADFGPLLPTSPATSFDGTVGTPFSQAVTAGGVGPYTFAVASGFPLGGGQTYGIPPGLALAAVSTGVVLSGTPTKAGTYLFTMQAGDSQHNSFEQQDYTVVIS